MVATYNQCSGQTQKNQNRFSLSMILPVLLYIIKFWLFGQFIEEIYARILLKQAFIIVNTPAKSLINFIKDILHNGNKY